MIRKFTIWSLGNKCVAARSRTGVAQLEHMNIALLAKWWWRLIDTPENTICKILKQKYDNRQGS